MAETDKLSVINNPNRLGPGCNVGVNTVDLGGRICMLGLPSFNQSIFYSKIDSQNLCAGSATGFSYESQYSNPSSVSWNFGDASTSNGLNPSHQFTHSGTFTVTVSATYQGITITRTKDVTIAAAPVANAIAEQFFCIGASQSYNLAENDNALLAGQPAGCTVTYFATEANAQSGTNPITTCNLSAGTTTIYARITNPQGCSTTTAFKLTSFNQPVDTAPTDFSTCDGMVRDGVAPFDLSTKTPEILNGQPQGNFEVSYFTSQESAEHNTDAVSDTFYNTVNPQPIFARVSNGNGCYKIITFKLIVETCADDSDESAFPKFFTPNGDGYNDTWKTKAVVGADKMKIQIFDRFGRWLKTITSADPEWDGTLGGVALPSDDYWFIVSGENIAEYRGHFSLKR
ncbi:MAG: T9SS type B sorting domain-containing protein [Flavobacterium sp.]|nr:MAG: T9SS type B sorting domain-containing protein [Flavobacterium sp.]